MAIAFQHLVHDEKKDVTRIVDHRIRVYDVVGYTRQGYTPQDIAEDYRLPLAAVYEALAYAEEHPAEMAALEAREEQGYRKALAQSPPELRAQVEAAMAAEKAGRAEKTDGPPVL